MVGCCGYMHFVPICSQWNLHGLVDHNRCFLHTIFGEDFVPIRSHMNTTILSREKHINITILQTNIYALHRMHSEMTQKWWMS